MKIYVIGSLRDKAFTEFMRGIRYEFEDREVSFWDDWYGAGYEADDMWQRYEQSKGLTYKQALQGDNAEHVYSYDTKHLHESSIAILKLPAGKSAHLELGYMVGLGKHTIIYMDKEPDRWDVMYRFASHVSVGFQDLTDHLSPMLVNKQ